MPTTFLGSILFGTALGVLAVLSVLAELWLLRRAAAWLDRWARRHCSRWTGELAE